MSKVKGIVSSTVTKVAVIFAAAAVAIALIPSRAAQAPDPIVKVADPVLGSTSVAFSPASNPAFKVIGATACASGRKGTLWQNAVVTVTSIASEDTNKVVLTFPGGSAQGPVNVSIEKSAGWQTTIPTTQAFDCNAVQSSALTYSAQSKKGNSDRGSAASGSYPIVKVD